MDNFEGYPMPQFVQSDDHLEEICEYLAGGGDPNQKVIGTNTLLHVAAYSSESNEKVVQKLIDAGADIESTTSAGSTPLHFAVMSRNYDAFEILIRAGAQINVKNVLGRTALHYSVTNCSVTNGDLGMHAVCCTPDMLIMDTLLEQDHIDVNPVDSEGETPLMWAVKHGWLDAVDALLKSVANPNIFNKQSQNCLHVALSVPEPNHYIVTELLLNGPGIYDVDMYGRTPVDYLLQYASDDSTFLFVLDNLVLIAFKYQIREDLKCKVRMFPQLSECFRCACQEVEWMSEQIIYDNITLHDFASDCFQERGSGDPTLEIYKPMVETLLSGMSYVYLGDILNRVSRQDLCNVLRRYVSPAYYAECLMDSPRCLYQTNLQIFKLIQVFYRKMRQSTMKCPVRK